MKIHSLIIAIIAFPSFLLSACSQPANEVNLYSARKEALIKPLLDAFTKQTNIKVNIISSKADALLERIENEGQNSPADVLLTSDAGRLWRAKQAGVLATIDSTTLQQRIPAQYRDPEKQWFGLSVRLRPIMVIKNTDLQIPKNYEDLANPRYKGKICIRSSNNIYNQSLVASILAHNGEASTSNWLNGLVANFARKPQGGDRDQIRASAAGQCQIVIANTYYLANMLADKNNTDDISAAEKISVIWPNQSNRGAHANISGAGVLKTAPNKANAIKLIEYLNSDEAQQIYADVNLEYPVVNNINVNPILGAWGEFKSDLLNLSELGKNNPQAVKLMDQAGWK